MMETPRITIDGTMIEMPAPKARIWREIIKFDEERKEIPTADFVENHCAIIAVAFGLTTDEVLENLNVEEVLPLYRDVLTYISGLLTAKLAIKKNVEETVAVQS